MEQSRVQLINRYDHEVVKTLFERLFVEEEIQEGNELETALKQLIKEDCIRRACKPASFRTRLVQAGMDDELALGLAQVWATHAGECLEQARAKSVIYGPRNIDNVDLSLNVQVASHKSNTVVVPSVIMQMDTIEKEAKVTLEMNGDELRNFYDQLELVQSSLDKLRE